ncbi:MAG: gliding motility-associated C-terminal domain-containing protein, partial [Luteibaculum sp.]
VSRLNTLVSFFNKTNGDNTYYWDFAGLDSSDLRNPQYRFPDQDTGTYQITLIAESEFGCIDSTWRFIKVSDRLTLFIPNSFTPDGDGNNDVFLPVLPWDDVEFFHMTIYNRWGEIIYETFDANAWDGTYQNRPAPRGTYAFQIEAKASFEPVVQKAEGKILLLR